VLLSTGRWSLFIVIFLVKSRITVFIFDQTLLIKPKHGIEPDKGCILRFLVEDSNPIENELPQDIMTIMNKATYSVWWYGEQTQCMVEQKSRQIDPWWLLRKSTFLRYHNCQIVYAICLVDYLLLSSSEFDLWVTLQLFKAAHCLSLLSPSFSFSFSHSLSLSLHCLFPLIVCHL
jgi:hypothetical protein